jgi:hypothetical protein
VDTTGGRFRRLGGGVQHDPARYRPAGRQDDQARRVNDAELATTAATVDKNMDAFQKAYAGALTANTSLTPRTVRARFRTSTP